jgi:glutamine synthetase
MVASVLAAGLDGIKQKMKPNKAAEGWAYEDEADPLLPLTFTEALDSLEADPLFADLMGPIVISTHLTLKRDEIERYEAEVSDPSTREITAWELDEYIWDY